MIGIYRISCICNNKVYIGSSVDIDQRWRDHKTALRNNRHYNKYLQRAWSKYGESNFEFSIVEELLSDELLLEREQCWMNLSSCCDKLHGYNVSKIAGKVSYEFLLAKARKWIVRTPEYQEIEVFNLRNFARENGLDYKCLKGVSCGKIREHQNWHVRHDNLTIQKWVQNWKGRNPDSKWSFWIATNKEGCEFFVTNLRHFCRLQKLEKSHMRKIANGLCDQAKGWHCRYADMTMAEWIDVRNAKPKNIAALNWICISPSNERYEIKNLAEFCKVHNLVYSCMANLANGYYSLDKYKGWSCEHQP